MRIAHISKVTGISGSEGHLLRLLPGLARRGLTPHMIILEDPRYPVEPFYNALRERNVPASRVAISSHFDLSLPDRLARAIRTFDPQIVHTHLIHADVYGTLAARQARVPHQISSRHNDDAFRRHPILKLLTWLTMQPVDRVIAISESVSQFVASVEQIDQNKIVTIHYGLEPPEPGEASRAKARARLGYPETELLVGAFGRHVRQKGFDILLEAFAIVRRKLPNVSLVLVGDGPMRSALEAHVHALQIEAYVQLTGWVENGRRLMPACDVIAVPSRWEGFGLVTLEAMGYALPLVVTQVSALPEIVEDRVTGLHVPPEDPQALAEALITLLCNPVQARELGAAGSRRLIEHFSVEAMVEKTIQVYEDVTRMRTG